MDRLIRFGEVKETRKISIYLLDVYLDAVLFLA